MDKLISAKLKAEYGFSEADFEAFVSTFEQNKGTYTAKSTDTFDTLYSMIDIVTFKK